MARSSLQLAAPRIRDLALLRLAAGCAMLASVAKRSGKRTVR